MFLPKAVKPEKPSPLNEQLAHLDTPPSWLRRALGVAQQAVPALLRTPHIQPVAEVYRPPLSVVQATNATAIIATGGIAFRPPAGFYWEVIAAGFLFTASATVGNRVIFGAVLQGVLGSGQTKNLFRAGANFNHTAGLAAVYSLGAHGVVGNTFTTSAAPLIPAPSRLVVPDGFQLEFGDFASVDTVADTFTQIAIAVRQHAIEVLPQ